MAVGEKLGKFKWEVEEQSPEELAYWSAWFDMKHKAEKAAIEKAKAQQKASQPRAQRRR